MKFIFFGIGCLKEVVCSKLKCVILQLKYGRAINFAVGRPDWNPAFALVQMTVYRGKDCCADYKSVCQGKQVLPLCLHEFSDLRAGLGCKY